MAFGIRRNYKKIIIKGKLKRGDENNTLWKIFTKVSKINIRAIITEKNDGIILLPNTNRNKISIKELLDININPTDLIKNHRLKGFD